MLNNVSAPQSLKRVRTSDDDLAELADRLPGFGGFYYDGEQRLNVWLKDPGRRGEAEIKVADLLRRRTGRARERAESNAARVQGMRVRQAQYDFRQLLTWYRGHVLPNVMRLEGITMTDIDERVNRIRVGVANESYLVPTRRLLGRLPIPPAAIEVIVEAEGQPDTRRAESVYGGMTSTGFLHVTVVDALGVERTASLLIDYDPEAQLYCM